MANSQVEADPQFGPDGALFAVVNVYSTATPADAAPLARERRLRPDSLVLTGEGQVV
ncbi:MAG: hypothetical protein LAO04_22695 [Acidobacteriia bacterium]|nr:hypothetical protein [Terriglobia bacterium]